MEPKPSGGAGAKVMNLTPETIWGHTAPATVAKLRTGSEAKAQAARRRESSGVGQPINPRGERKASKYRKRQGRE